MNKYLIAGLMALLVGVGGHSQKSDAAACATATTYAGLQALGSCDIGDKTYSNFTYTPTQVGGATIVPATSFTIAAIFSGPTFWGFSFAFPLTAGSNQVNDILLGYTVTCNGAGGRPLSCIDSNELTINGGATGTGTAIVTETICKNATTTVGCPAGNTLSLIAAFPSPLAASDVFTPNVPMEAITKDINVAGGSNGTSSISNVINTQDQGVPEPATLALLGASLFSMAAIRRRKTRT